MSNALNMALGDLDNIQSINGGNIGGLRNHVINGDFNVWQENTSFPNPADGDYTADQWVVTKTNTSGTCSIFREEFVAGHTEVPGNPRYYLRYDYTVAASGLTYNDFQQRLEDVRVLGGKTVTITAYIRHSTQTTLPEIFVAQDFGSGGSATVFTTVETNVSISSAFSKVQFTVDIPSVSSKVINANSFTAIAFRIPLNVVGTFDIAHVSVIEGDVTEEFDPYPHIPEPIELLLCERFYEKSYGIGVNAGSVTSRGASYHRASGSYTSAPIMHERFRVPKRTIPSITLYSPNNGGTGTVYNRSNATNYNGYTDVPELTGFWWGVTSAAINDQDFVEVHWVADARL